MSDKPRVSVIVPTFNRAHFLSDAINSILEQSYTNFEVLIIDDCSTDNTREVINQFTDHRVKYHKLAKNIGPAGARNFGLAHTAKNVEYIAFLDSDDIWLPKKLEYQVAFLDKNPVYGAICGNLLSHDLTTGRRTLRRKKENATSGFIWDKIFSNPWDFHFLYLETTCIRQDVVKRIGLFKESMKISEDWDFTFRLVAQTRIHTFPDAVAITRIHSGQITQNINSVTTGNKLERHYWSGNREATTIAVMKSMLNSEYIKTPRMRQCLRMGIGNGYFRTFRRNIRNKDLAFFKNFFLAFFYNPTESLRLIFNLTSRRL